MVDHSLWKLIEWKTKEKENIKARQKIRAKDGGTTLVVELLEKVEAVEKEDDTTRAKAKENRKVNLNPKAKTSARKARTRARLTINNAEPVENMDTGAEIVRTGWCSR